jgi:hypothetical protein
VLLPDPKRAADRITAAAGKIERTHDSDPPLPPDSTPPPGEDPGRDVSSKPNLCTYITLFDYCFYDMLPFYEVGVSGIVSPKSGAIK